MSLADMMMGLENGDLVLYPSSYMFCEFFSGKVKSVYQRDNFPGISKFNPKNGVICVLHVDSTDDRSSFEGAVIKTTVESLRPVYKVSEDLIRGEVDRVDAMRSFLEQGSMIYGGFLGELLKNFYMKLALEQLPQVAEHYSPFDRAPLEFIPLYQQSLQTS